jgi:DNA-binding response OmpR family regulator
MRADDRIIRVGALALDVDGFSATVDGQDLPLTYGEFLIMEALLRNPYQVLNREQLVDLLRQGSRGLGGVAPELRSVDTHIARLRAKLRTLGYDCIRTMRFVGYRFVPPSQRDHEPGQEAASRDG